MSSQTQLKLISDIVKNEFLDGMYTREVLTLADLSGVTVVVGEVLQYNAAGTQLVQLDATVDEVHVITTTGTLSGGSFTITFVDRNGVEISTGPLAHNANLATIQAAIDAALGVANGCVASGSSISALTLTFSGTGYEGRGQGLTKTNAGGLTGATKCTVARTARGGSGDHAAAVALQEVTTDGATGSILCLVRGPASVDSSELDVNAGTLADAVAALKLKGITAV